MRGNKQARALIAASLALVAITAASGPAHGSARGAPADGAAEGLPPVADQARYRADLGLPATEQVVTDLNAQWQAGALPGATTEGAVLTPSEEAELDMRDAAADEIAPLARNYFTGSLTSAFGGVFIDNAAGKVAVLVTRDVAGFERELRARIADPSHADRLVVRKVAFALADLNRVVALLDDRSAALRAAGTVMHDWGVFEDQNAVVVHVPHDTADVRSVVLAALPQPYRPMVRFGQSSGVQLTGVSGVNSPPLKGGQEINRITTDGNLVQCTSAFVTYYNRRTDAGIYIKDYYLVSAGHCSDSSTNYFTQGLGYAIGYPDRNLYANNGTDGLRIAIRIADKSQLVAITASNDRYIYGQQATIQDRVGDRTCVSGSRTGGERCGTLQSTNVTISPAPDFFTLKNMRQATYFTQPGDSGGSVLADSTALGVTSATDGGGHSFYTHIGYVIPRLGLTAVEGV
jgi:hypothetical protein